MKNYCQELKCTFCTVSIKLILFSLLLNFAAYAQQPGNALRFDGVNDYVALPNALTTATTSASNNGITIEYWFRGTSITSAVRFNNANGYIISGYGMQHIISTDGGTTGGVAIPSTIFDGRWHHIAMTWQKGIADGFKSYVDGQVYAKKNAANVSLPNLSSGGFLGSYNGTNEFINGSLDEVRIYNYALSQANIQADMVSNTSSVPLSLLAWYHFNQGTAGGTNTGIISVRDTSGHNYHGTATNFSLNNSNNNNSNWIESFAMVVPLANNPSNINSSGFTASWAAPAIGSVNNYYLDVSTNASFTGTISTSPYNLSATTYSQNVSGLQSGTYYYRVRANKTSVADQGAVSKTISVTVPFSPPGNALAFDGINDYVTLPNGFLSTLTGSSTIETWFLYNGGGNWQRLFDFGSGINSFIMFSPQPAGSDPRPILVINNNVEHRMTAPRALITGKWYHLAITINAVSNKLSMYLNGELAGELNGVTFRLSQLGNSSQNWLGRSQYYYQDNHFNGKIDEFRIWNLARTQNEIQTYMDTIVSPLSSNLIYYYNFDQGVTSLNNNEVNSLINIKDTTQINQLNNFSLNNSTSNWVESYAMAIPNATQPTAISTTGFTANWTAPSIANINNYFIDVATDANFISLISGSPFTVSGNTTFSRAFTNLQSNLNYYYRVRADRTILGGQGAFSNTTIARTANAYTPPGNCLALDGVNDYIKIPVSSGINNRFSNNRITLETWVYLKSLPTGDVAPALITENYNGAGGYNIKFSIYLYRNGLYGGYHNGNWTSAKYLTPLTLNRWTHVACTYDQTQIKLYVNGVLVATQNATLALPYGSEDWSIGKRWDYLETVNGYMDEVRIYNEALTENQIISDMRDTTIALPENLVAYYNFDQGNASGTNTEINTLTDRSSSTSYTGALQNFALSSTNSNWVSSYAMVVPRAMAASAVTANGFTANWTAPLEGIVNGYVLDIATNTDFTAPISGSPFTLSNTTFSQSVSGLISGTYYYRVRANNTSLSDQGAFSNTIAVLVAYVPPGNALAFDGINDMIVTPVSNTYINNFTMEAWVNPGNLTSDWQTIFAYGFDNAYTGNGISLYLSPAGEITIQYPAINTVNTGYKLALYRWSHIALTRSGGSVKIFVNGEQLPTVTTNNPYGPTGEFRIGGHTGIRFLNGKIDECRFWSYAKTKEQILAGIINNPASNSPGLVVYYNFDQGVSGANNSTTNIIYDQTPNLNNGTLTNFTLSGNNSNWVESYAKVRPTALAATAITSSSFTANFSPAIIGTVNNYFIEVSTTPDFTGPIIGSPFSVASNAVSKQFTGLLGGTYYYRVIANKTSLANQGAYSNVIAVDVPYTPPGNALAFDGVNDYAVSHSTNTGNFGAGNFTVEYWINTTDNMGYHITKRSGCTGGSFWSIGHGMVANNPNRLYMEINNLGSYQIVLTPVLQKPINDGRWHHMALVRQGVKATIYIDGEEVSTGTSTGVANVNNGGHLYIGTSTCGNPLNGKIDEVRLWNIARSQDSIIASMKREMDTSAAGLLTYFDFNQGVGGLINYGRSVIIDKKGNTDNYMNLANMSLEALNTNWVESYATVVPTMTEPTNITPSGFTLNWTAPAIGVVTNYLLDVSLSSNFTAPISGSPFNISGLSHTLSGLASSTFYCRVRANRSSTVVDGEGGPSNVKIVRLEYTPPGNALQFDGSNDYGTITKAFSGDFTLEYWVKTTQTGSGSGTSQFYQGNGIVSNESSTGDFGTALIGGKLAFGVNETTIQSNTTINTGKWFHVAVTRNSTSGLIRIYINGNLETNATGATGALSASSVITLGATNNSGGTSSASFNGALDELRIWNVERTGSEISQYYRDTINRNSTGLLDYYSFDQGIGGANNTGVTTLKDIAGTDNGGTITNFSLSGTASNWVNSYGINVTAPNSLLVSNDVCSRIDLSWQLGSALPTSNCDLSVFCDPANFRQYVYADDNLLAEFPFSTTSCSFNVNEYYNNIKLIRGVNYKFKVITAYVPGVFNYIKLSSPSNIVVGKFKPNPVVPSGFTASLAKCDGSVDLGWTWTDANPQNGFVITRSEDSIVTSPNITILTGTQRSFTDNGLQRGKLYFYRIYARNDCYEASAADSMFAGVSDTQAVVGGLSPQVPVRASNVRLFADSTNNTITIRWNDNSNNEDKFGVERAAVGGLTTTFDTNPNDTVYVDEQAAGCVSYNYTIRAYSGCALNGIPSIGLNQTRITPNLSNTFEDSSIYKLKCSKGYYPDRVELNWNNRNSPQLTSMRIYRKIANSANDSIMISSLLPGSGLYIDNTTVAGVLYRYFIIGETQCGGVTRFSNITSDIGFRSPSGIINGSVKFAGGFAVENVRVLAQNTSFNKGGAIAFDGVNDYMEIKHKESQNPGTNALTIEAWFKPITQNSFIVAAKQDSLGGYLLRYDSDSNQLIFTLSNNISSQTVKVDSPFVSFTSYNQITATYDSDSIRIYINGLEGKSVQTSISFLGSASSSLYFGGSPELNIYGKGNLDEVRIWKIAKTKSQIVNDFNRTIETNNGNLMVYLTFDDRFPGLTETYDQSNLNLVFNENHARLLNGAVYTDSIPSTSQLALASYTDINGNYSIPNVRYMGTGQNYTVVPSLGIHVFAPANRVIFIGDGSQSLNGIDFNDNSSFEFAGVVTYAGTTCPAAGASVLIDGQYVVKNNQLLTVNDSGKFVVQVPIGNHYVSLIQNKHVFSNGRFPERSLFNFTGPVSANFTDSTFLTIIGRVAGGNRELTKLPGLGRSKNNIGKAQFTFNSVGQSGITGCFSMNIVTNDSTGEYKANLLPLRYTINGLRLVNNPDPTLLTDPTFNNPNILDLSTIPEITNLYDTLVTPTFSRIDSISYHKQLDFKYYLAPKIYLTDTNTAFDVLVNNFKGEKTIEINDTTSLSIAQNELGYPVFLQGNYYTAVVKVLERYTNIDKLASDSSRFDNVPVSGLLRFYNNLALSDSISEAQINNGYFVYNFRGGVPNQLRNSINPQYSYTRTLQVEFVPEIGYTVNFLPNVGDINNQFFRGYVFGSRPGGSNFTTRGPALVDFVLRDPPGSASSTTWSKGTTYTKAESYNFSNSFSQSYSNMFDFGGKVTTYAGVGVGLGLSVQAGIITENETVANLTLGVTENRTTGTEGEVITSTTNNTTISTGSDPGSVGSAADVYYGKSVNLLFGNADIIELIDTANCRVLEATAGVPICSGTEVNGYKIGKRNGFYLVPGGIATTFAYTQDEILNLVIPDLEALRNQLFTNNTLNNRGQVKYTALFTDNTDAEFARKFGSNNDDPIWKGQRSSPTPLVREAKDSVGLSYLFRGNTRFETDSVRFYNDQIRLWKVAISRNEADKYRTINNSGAQPVSGGRNISIGKASLTQEFITQVDETRTESFEVSLNTDLSATFGFEILGIGNEFTSTFSFEKTSGKSRSASSSIVNSFSYTLQDGDDGDLISVDVVDPKAGGSHLFKLRAGRTSCPYEGEEKAMFYDPSNDTITSTTLLEDGFEIQTATAQNDVPVISVDQKNNFNVPAGDDAIFILDLGNLSEGHQDRTYSLRVNENTNPYGAILKVDGLDPNRDFNVPYGTTVQKTLTLRRGPVNYDYNDIQLILKSACDDDIFDTVSISAKFLPTCTSVALKSPDDRWILNSSYNDTLPVLIGGYNYNWGGFKALHFQYKPGGTNIWYNEKSYFRDTLDVNSKIPVGEPNIFYPFKFKNLPDGSYELRAVTECIAPGYPNSRINSSVMQGLVDRVNPTPFGTPSPANGILSPNDDISIQFNEPIEQSTLSLSNFEVKGVLNKSNIRSNTSLYFDGNNDYLEVPQGLNLQLKPFTIEFWHKRGGLGQQVLFSQGADAASSIEVGFASDNKFYFRMGSETVVSNLAITDTSIYQFYAVSYNSTAQTADLFINEQVVNIGNNRIFNPYSGAGKFYMGKASFGIPKYAKGNLYEVRLWSIARSLTDVNQTKSKLLNGTDAGLMANWRMDEATGNSVRDYARSRTAIIFNAQWFLSPMGKSYTFDGNGDFITVPTTHFGISPEMDFTIEFWFKSNNGNNVGLLSNGTGELSATNAALKWSIETDSAGRIIVKHNGIYFQATNASFFDGNWHHFALVLRRNSSLSCYIDANLQNSIQSGSFGQWGGAKLWFGAKGWNNNGNIQFDSTGKYFSGQLDDLRFWNSSRLIEQIARDKNNRLNGNESGLVLYIPFESYQEVLGFPVLNSSNTDFTSNNTRSLTAFGNAVSSDESPTIKLPRAAQGINFTYGINGDKIIITPTTANEFIENVTLDITVKGINDKNGNTMQSPKTWIAFVDRNQVKWQDDGRNLNKLAAAPLSFDVTIINSGGALKVFNIGNLPSWLTASQTSASINPNSSTVITFTVDPTLNIGKYEQDLTLTTDFGFADKFILKLNVSAIAPDWNVVIGNYAKSMSIVGQVRINNVISANTDDLLGAFVNNVCRGIGKVQYYEQLDKYLVFMDVYGNTDNETLEFRIWNSASGKTHIQVDPSLNFVSNNLVGSVAAPQIFNALDKVSQKLPLQPGWNWMSFNLLMTDSSSLNQLFNNLKPVVNNQIKNNTQMAVYDMTNGWTGNLANINTGIKPELSYLFYAGQQDTLELRGIEANPSLRTISYSPGWNYLGFVSQRNMSTNEALSGLTASQNDLIKGQTNFSVYDTVLGWVGSLKTLRPNAGYLYKASASGSFNYPRSAMFGKKEMADETIKSSHWKIKPYKYATNMNLIGKVNACTNLQNTEGMLLGAFVNGDLRGYGNLQNIDGNEYVYFLNIAGNDGEKIRFKLLDEASGNEYDLDQNISYQSNSLTGSLSQPFQLSSASPCIAYKAGLDFNSNVYPVPFTESLTIEFNIPQSCTVNIRIKDITGKENLSICKDEMFAKGLHQINWKSMNLPVGVHIVEIENSGNTIRHKVIKL
ncbi:MAG: LamG-like jellyroll fold domain-containing protein [Bacteroidota bacterium]|nr:LamG-like jellyroll fold domain-containing protein [Bacteroidota bacterium]